MASVKLPWKRKNLTTGEWETTMLGLALRPIELWEVVVPEECLMETLAMQHTKDGNNSVLEACNNLRPEIKNYALLMQKLLGLKPYPKFEKPTKLAYRFEKDGEILPVNWVPTDGFAVYPLGIRSDIKQDFPNYADENSPKGYFQEGV
jgi:hypothetical protein